MRETNAHLTWRFNFGISRGLASSTRSLDNFNNTKSRVKMKSTGSCFTAITLKV